MNILTYLDLAQIFKEVKANQFKEYPKAKDYIKFLQSIDEDCAYVTDMYEMLNDEKYLSTLSFADPEEYTLEDIYDGENITIELSIGGNDANESTNYNEWAYGYEFKINLDYELFEGYKENNYS